MLLFLDQLKDILFVLCCNWFWLMIQAACAVVTNELKDHVVSIDAADVNDELAVVEYVDDLYKF